MISTPQEPLAGAPAWALPLSTLLFGPDLLIPQISMESVAEYKPKVIEWIKGEGLGMVDGAQGHEASLSQVLDVVRDHESATIKLEKVTKEFDQQSMSIDKAKSRMLAKWSVTQGSDDPRVIELEEWARGKKQAAKLPVLQQSDEIKRLDSLMDSHIFALLQQLQVEQDPELDALVQELDSKFQALSLEGEAKSGELGEPGITVESAALDKIRELPDGPQKSALLAVLEAAVVTPDHQVPQPYMHIGSLLLGIEQLKNNQIMLGK